MWAVFRVEFYYTEPMPKELTAAAFAKEIRANQSDEELRKIRRYFKSGEGEYGEGDVFIGVRMGTIFDVAKSFVDMPPAEIEILLDNDIHEMRVGALSIMEKQFRAKKTTEPRKKELYELYLRRHDRIDNWDLVDLAARHVVGGYLADKPRDALYRLAVSANMWERRTAMFATAYFVKNGEVDDVYKLAKLLLADPEDLIHKVVGGMLRSAGTVDAERLVVFLDEHARLMPRTMLRYAIEHFTPEQRTMYLSR